MRELVESERVSGELGELVDMLLKSKQDATLFFRFHKLPLKTTEKNHFFEEKIEKVGVLF